MQKKTLVRAPSSKKIKKNLLNDICSLLFICKKFLNNFYTILKSTFINKDAREQFEMKVHKRLIDVWNPTSKTMEMMNSLNLPAGVDIEIKL